MLYGFMALVALVLFIRLQHVNYQQKQAEQIQARDYVMSSGDLVGSPLAAALDPRVDTAMVAQQMMTPRYDQIQPAQTADTEPASEQLAVAPHTPQQTQQQTAQDADDDRKSSLTGTTIASSTSTEPVATPDTTAKS